MKLTLFSSRKRVKTSPSKERITVELPVLALNEVKFNNQRERIIYFFRFSSEKVSRPEFPITKSKLTMRRCWSRRAVDWLFVLVNKDFFFYFSFIQTFIASLRKTKKTIISRYGLDVVVLQHQQADRSVRLRPHEDSLRQVQCMLILPFNLSKRPKFRWVCLWTTSRLSLTFASSSTRSSSSIQICLVSFIRAQIFLPRNNLNSMKRRNGCFFPFSIFINFFCLFIII